MMNETQEQQLMSFHLISLLFVSACLAFAAQEPTATSILQRVAQTYKDLKSQSVEATMVLEVRDHRIEVPITGATTKPGKLRLEVHNAMVGSQTISDGRNLWQYVAGFQQYIRKPAKPGLYPMTDGPGDILAGENILDRLKAARRLRQEKLRVDGKDIECDVIEAEYTPAPGDVPKQNGPKTIWVERQRHTILKVSAIVNMPSVPGGEALESITVTSIRLNPTLPDSLFTFVPPKEAQEVRAFLPPVGRAPGLPEGADGRE
jgi:outer membrane lipoprotein-sorting protein